MSDGFSEFTKVFPMVDVSEKTARAAGSDPEDLSKEIEQAVDRLVGDNVRCTRVTASTYRCNWWSAVPTGGYDNPAMGGMLVTTHRVRRSRYLHVTKGAGGELEIRESSRTREEVAN